MTSFRVPATWNAEQLDAVAVFLERLFGDVCAHVPLDALFCTTCVREQLHLPLDADAAFVDECRHEGWDERSEFDWSPPQLAAVVRVMREVDRYVHALYEVVIGRDGELVADGGSADARQLELSLRRDDTEPVRVALACDDLPF